MDRNALNKLAHETVERLKQGNNKPCAIFIVTEHNGELCLDGSSYMGPLEKLQVVDLIIGGLTDQIAEDWNDLR